MKVALALSVACLAISGCASKSIDSLVADGGRIVQGGLGELVGEGNVTFTAVDGTWSNYFTTDGIKRAYVKPLDEQKTLEWRVRDDGIFCQQLFSSEKEQCDDEGDRVVVMRADGVVSVFTNGKIGKYPFKVSEGDTAQ